MTTAMTLATRVIARLDLKRSLGVVKGRALEGLRRVGAAATLAVRYEAQGADELLLLDITASLYRQPLALDLLGALGPLLTTPVTVGGGVRTFEDFRAALRHAGEKVALCTQALRTPALITACAHRFGSQAVVVEVQVRGDQAVYHAGREPSGRNAVEWACEAVDRGAGELLITSVERDGTRRGMDLATLEKLAPRVSVPIVASGGAGCARHCLQALDAGASAVAVSTILHQGVTIGEIKRVLADEGVEVRL